MTSRPRQVPTRSPKEGNERTPTMSGRGAILALILVFVFLYAVRWAVLPFVLAAVGAYICTPLVDWLANRTRVPRLFFVCAIVVTLLVTGTAVALLGGPALLREAASTVADLGATLERFARGAIGEGTIQFFGQSMNASQFAGAAVTGLRNWIDQTGMLVMLAGWSFGAVFGTFLTLVLLFFFSRTVRDWRAERYGSCRRSIARWLNSSGLGSIRF
jgi:predicted PurR-regulated permease PerM